MLTYVLNISWRRPLLRWAPKTVQSSPSRTFQFSSTNYRSILGSRTYSLLDPSLRVEEETFTWYKAENYYPVKLGELLQDRYRVIGKLGYGTKSTVWLCRDLRHVKTYIALKVCCRSSTPNRELSIYNHINSLHSLHGGRTHIRRLLNSFEVQGPNGIHTCLVQQPLGMNLEDLRERVPDGELASDLVRQTLRDILRGLHFLHKEAGIVHTGQFDIPHNVFAY
jgi:hypothetical protein